MVAINDTVKKEGDMIPNMKNNIIALDINSYFIFDPAHKSNNVPKFGDSVWSSGNVIGGTTQNHAMLITYIDNILRKANEITLARKKYKCPTIKLIIYLEKK